MAKTTKKQIEAVQRYDNKAYFKTLVRFPKDMEQAIRDAAEASGRTLNNFLVSSACAMAGLPEPVLQTAGRKPKDERME